VPGRARNSKHGDLNWRKTDSPTQKEPPVTNPLSAEHSRQLSRRSNVELFNTIGRQRRFAKGANRARSRRSARRVLRTECAVGPVHSVMCALDPKASQVAPATDQEIPVARPIFFLRRRNRERALTPSLGLHTGRKLALDTKQRRAVLPFPTPCNCAGRKTRWHRYSRGPSLRLTNS
jgi:hypothetical protein